MCYADKPELCNNDCAGSPYPCDTVINKSKQETILMNTKNPIITLLVTITLSSCAVMPEGQEPTLYRKGLPHDLIKIIEPVDQQLDATKTNNGVHLKYSNKGHRVN